MLSPDTAMHAVRLMGIDVANCMTKLAVYQATAEELLEAAVMVDSRAWEPLMADDDVPTVTGVKLPLDQNQALQRILMLIEGLR